jgi:hypothetical protein
MGDLSAHLHLRTDLGEAQTAQMYALYARYYDAVTPARFQEDLSDKRWVIVLNEDAQLRGFTTVTLDEVVAEGSRRRAVFSGDTIIDHRYWGEQALTDAFCRLAGSLKAMEPATPLYWFLISKGYRTFRYLNLFARRYFPHPEQETPPEIAACLDSLASRRFGAAWLGQQGLVRFAQSHGHLKPQWAGVREGLRRHEDIRFFLERNPGYAHGDELACIAELTGENLRGRAARAFQEGVGAASRVLPLDR